MHSVKKQTLFLGRIVREVPAIRVNVPSELGFRKMSGGRLAPVHGKTHSRRDVIESILLDITLQYVMVCFVELVHGIIPTAVERCTFHMFLADQQL